MLARKAFPGQSAVGRTLLARISTPEAERFEIIGVVDHQRHASLAREGREAVFVPDGYMGHGGGEPMGGADDRRSDRRSREAVRAAVAELNPRAGVIEVQPMTASSSSAHRRRPSSRWC